MTKAAGDRPLWSSGVMLKMPLMPTKFLRPSSSGPDFLPIGACLGQGLIQHPDGVISVAPEPDSGALNLA